MSTAGPITALTVITDVDELTETAETYARMADELAAMVENSDDAGSVAGRIAMNRLGALYVELDELTATTPTRGRLVTLVHEVDELRRWLEGIPEPSVTMSALTGPLDELHTALVDLVAAQDWRVTA